MSVFPHLRFRKPASHELEQRLASAQRSLIQADERLAALRADRDQWVTNCRLLCQALEKLIDKGPRLSDAERDKTKAMVSMTAELMALIEANK